MRLHTRLQSDGSYLWTLVRSADDPAPVARAEHGVDDIAGCVRAAALVFAAPPQAVHPVHDPGGGWRWAVCDETGATVATSAEAYTCPAFCGYALHDIRRRTH